VADVPGTKDKYVALFNTSPPPPPGRGRRGPPPVVELADNSAGATHKPVAAPPTKEPVSISVSLADIGIAGSATVRDLWRHKDLGSVTGTVSATVNSHGAILFRIHPQNSAAGKSHEAVLHGATLLMMHSGN
jgi:hypothetical protein